MTPSPNCPPVGIEAHLQHVHTWSNVTDQLSLLYDLPTTITIAAGLYTWSQCDVLVVQIIHSIARDIDSLSEYSITRIIVGAGCTGILKWPSMTEVSCSL